MRYVPEWLRAIDWISVAIYEYFGWLSLGVGYLLLRRWREDRDEAQ